MFLIGSAKEPSEASVNSLCCMYGDMIIATIALTDSNSMGGIFGLSIGEPNLYSKFYC